MRRAVIAIVATLLAAALTANIGRAQGPLAPAHLDDRCAACQRPGDDGAADIRSPSPGNPGFAGIESTLSSIPLPKLSTGEIAAIVTYIRMAWDDDVELVTPEEIAAVIDVLGGGAAEQVTIWDGVFTSDQIARGEAAYITCTPCKGSSQGGAAGDAGMIAFRRGQPQSRDA